MCVCVCVCVRARARVVWCGVVCVVCVCARANTILIRNSHLKFDTISNTYTIEYIICCNFKVCRSVLDMHTYYTQCISLSHLMYRIAMMPCDIRYIINVYRLCTLIWSNCSVKFKFWSIKYKVLITCQNGQCKRSSLTGEERSYPKLILTVLKSCRMLLSLD